MTRKSFRWVQTTPTPKLIGEVEPGKVVEIEGHFYMAVDGAPPHPGTFKKDPFISLDTGVIVYVDSGSGEFSNVHELEFLAHR